MKKYNKKLCESFVFLAKEVIKNILNGNIEITFIFNLIP